MASRITNFLLIILIIEIGIATTMQFDANNRMQPLLQNILAQLQDGGSQRSTQLDIPQPEPTIIVPEEEEPETPPQTTPVQAQPVPSSSMNEDTSATQSTPPPAADEQPQPEPSTTPASPDSPAADFAPSPSAEKGPAQMGQEPSDSAIAPSDEPDTPPAPAAKPKTPADAEWERLESEFNRIVYLLLSGDYKPVIAQFDHTMSEALTEEALASVMDKLRKEHGEMVRISDHQRITGISPDLSAYQLTVQTQRGSDLIFTLTLDRRNRIAGMFVKAAGNP